MTCMQTLLYMELPPAPWENCHQPVCSLSATPVLPLGSAVHLLEQDSPAGCLPYMGYSTVTGMSSTDHWEDAITEQCVYNTLSNSGTHFYR